MSKRSKRLQVLLTEDEFKSLRRISHAQKRTVADWVRESIRRQIRSQSPLSPEKKLAAILKFARYSGPTGSIEELLSEIERGKAE